MKTRTHSWIVVLTTSLFFFYSFIQMNMFNSINESLAKEFAFSAKQISQLFSSYFWGNLFLVFPVGIILDRFSPKKLVITSFLSTVVLTYCFSIAHNFQFLWLIRLLIGICSASCFLSAVKVTSLWFEPKNTGFVISAFIALATLGGVIAQTPLSLLTIKMGWRTAMQLVALFGFILVLLQLFLVEDKKTEKDSTSELKQSFFTSLKMVLVNPQNWLAGSFVSLLNFPIYIFGGSWGVPFLRQVHNFSIEQATLTTSMIFIGMIVGSPFAGYYSDKKQSRKQPMLIGAFCAIVILALIMYLPEYSFFTGAFLFLIFGFIIGFQVVGYPVITESNHATVAATASSIGSILIVGAGILVSCFGKLLDLGGNKVVNGEIIYSSSDFLRANWFVMIGVIIALVAALLVKETFGGSYLKNAK